MPVPPLDWHDACIIQYKWKGDKYKCIKLSSVSLLSVVVKLYCRLLIKKVRDGTECAMEEEQCGFISG